MPRRRSCAKKRRLSWVACKAAQRPKTTAALAAIAAAGLWRVPAIKVPAMVAMHVSETDKVDVDKARQIALKVLNALPTPSGYEDPSGVYRQEVRQYFTSGEFSAYEIREGIHTIYNGM